MFASLMVLPLLGGCAKFSVDQGMGLVSERTTGTLGKDLVKIRSVEDARFVRDRVKSLLSKTVTADAAVQIALLNNRALQAAFNELGVSEAEMVQASLPPSPTLSLARLSVPGAVMEIERQVLQNVLGLLTLPRRKEIAQKRFQHAQMKAIEAVLRTAHDTRRTYYRAVSAGMTVIFLKRAQVTAESLSDLAVKLGETGAMGKLSQAREHAFYADVSRQLAMARLQHRSERDRLARMMGLWGEDIKFHLPDNLPKFPRRARREADVVRDAVANRIDLKMARLELQALASSYGLTEATRFINVLEVRGMSSTEWSRVTETDYELVGGDLVKTEERETEKERWRGIELEFQIPIYDFGESRVRGASESYFAAVNRLADKAINIRGEARIAYENYRGAHAIARIYRDKILPMRNVISEEMLLQYNGMIADLFELLQDQRARIASSIEAINAEREFWIASVDLKSAVIGGGNGGGAPAGDVQMAAQEEPGH